jgi:hypothetical protein
MRRYLFAFVSVALVVASTVLPAVAGDVSVRGHVRRDGTYVQPHVRSAPDRSYNNNWSTSPNINPYTGQQGTRQPRLFDSSGGLSGSGTNDLSGTGSSGYGRRKGW